MATLKELMGHLKHGDGRVFKLNINIFGDEIELFKPAYLQKIDDDEGYWYGCRRNGDRVIYSEDLPGWEELKTNTSPKEKK